MNAKAVSGFGNDERLRDVLEVERWIFPGLPETKGPGSQVSNRSGSIAGRILILRFFLFHLIFLYFVLFYFVLLHFNSIFLN